MRELAENCLEQLDKCPYKNEIDQEIVADAYMQFKKSQYRNNNISQLFKWWICEAIY